MENLSGKANNIKMLKLFFGIIIYVTVFIPFVNPVNTFGESFINNAETYSDSSGTGAAAPLAKFKKDADTWFKRLKTTKKEWLSKLPTKAELGFPVYPGAVLVVYQSGYHDSEESSLPEVILVSPDPPKKIEAWYAKQLKNWNHIINANVFLPPHNEVDIMSDKFDATPHVQIEKAFRKNQFDGIFLKQPANTKTGIIIRYKSN